MRAEIIHHKMNGARKGIGAGEPLQSLGELDAGAVGRGPGEVAASQGFHPAEHVGGPASRVFVVALGRLPRLGSASAAFVLMEKNWLFVQANHRLGRIIGLFVERQHIFHAFGIGGVKRRHAPHFFPATA